MNRDANPLLRDQLSAIIQRYSPCYHIYGRRVCDWDTVHELLPQIQLFSTKPQHKCNMYETLWSLVLIAVNEQNLEELKRLYDVISKRAPDVRYLVRIFEKRHSDGGKTVIHYALQGKVEIIQFLIEKCCPSGYEFLKVADNSGYTPLREAICYCKYLAIEYLLIVTPRCALPYFHKPPVASNLQGFHMNLSKYTSTDIELLTTVRRGLLLREARDAFEAETNLMGMGNELPILVLNVIGQQSELLSYRKQGDVVPIPVTSSSENCVVL